MSFSYTVSESKTFTVTHARHLASKVATDLSRMRRFYGSPSEQRILQFEEELVCLLKAGYLECITYGFRRNGNWIDPTLRYTAADLAGGFADDDDPGRVQPGRNVDGASFHSYLSYNWQFYALTSEQRQTFENTLPLQRGGAAEPGVSGYFERDLTYSSGGRALNRARVRNW